MRDEYDVIIAGAGPAGSTCAKILSQNGISPLLIDKKNFPRIKPCCGFLTSKAVSTVQRIFGQIPESILCNNREIEFQWSSTGKNYNSVKGYDLFLNLYRERFDSWLLEKSDAEFLGNSTVETFDQIGDKIAVDVLTDGKNHTFRCKYLICATGANSRLRKILDKNYQPKNAGVGIQKVYRGHFECDKSIYYVNISRKFTDNAFSFFYFKDDLFFIGTGWTGKYDGYFERWFDFLKQRYNPELELIRDERCCIEYKMEPDCLFFGNGNVIYAGEASGLIENWGIGITSALISGEKAAFSIIQNKSDLANTYISNIKPELDSLQRR